MTPTDPRTVRSAPVSSTPVPTIPVMVPWLGEEEALAAAEAVRCKAIDDGVPVPDISRATYGEK